MIVKTDFKVKQKLYPLFKGLKDTQILSCLQGHMGEAWVDDPVHPTVAQITVGDFTFFAGDAYSNTATELLGNIPDRILAIVHTKEWADQLEARYQGAFEKIKRYRFRKQATDLKIKPLEDYVAKLPENYELKRIDRSNILNPSLHAISEDFTGNFHSIEDFLERGIGYCVLYNGKVVCGASSYSVYNDGIEIEIGTNPDYRRKGLAKITASALILECLEKGWYPSWDAANLASARLAEQLGYVMEGAYDSYFIVKEE
ncbi:MULTISPECIES: GNAT family N-acetyltransferase [Virgibacillus]|uniref:GNAT acetyltransferase n=2 Tax=Virgibacillus TaxID=84406 RepID=A0A024QHK5_9BACI|nr:MULTISPECIES: GNAT family N-acetyltransferase [Virgibacillus]EQB36904.1 hypothetical protein M948_10780 [Virgibacillus sp. CM-4]MYL43081.1 GNAT family N-acetyltransferase [Virgibacillus massiliensis]GGJ65229.1 zwittermicin A resistance protein ZmaR [Virgibacillus kapii]CDQ42008.1 GNAT acetyltransferase [Virgibacillus massiliensis]